MALGRIFKAAAAVSAAGGVVFFGMMMGSSKTHADDSDTDQNLAMIGLNIAPSFISINGKDQTLVGLGSYFVNRPAIATAAMGRTRRMSICLQTIHTGSRLPIRSPSRSPRRQN
jgi:hypothetical protein